METDEKFDCQALWDTGATGTVITQKVVDALGLKSTGIARVFHADGESEVETYEISITLPNNTVFHLIKVTKAKLAGFDVLIGMDIITTGDFSITNLNGNTVFSFRIPSMHEVDFTKEKNEPIIAGHRQNRNALCECGSGKKYKQCHGR